jgi:cyclophilin family peptidyl-prolyl cis-trans isomerase
MWDLLESKPAAAYPVAVVGPAIQRGEARLRAPGGWGIDVVEDPPPEQEALVLLEEIQRERPETEPAVLVGFLGYADGRRREAPLVALEERLARLAEERPDYVSLRFNLGAVISGRNDPERALAVFRKVHEDFPMLRFNERQVMLEAQLLRDAGRYGEAIALLDESEELLTDKPRAAVERSVLECLEESWKTELEIRAEEEERDDLPRVELETSKGKIVLELLEDDAPNAVANFVSLVERGFYDGTRFHWADSGGRVVGGDPNSRDDDPYNDGFGDAGYLIEPEPGRRLLLPHMVSFADRRGERRAEGGVFVIHISPLPGFDGVNSTFARVVGGRDVVRRIEYYDTLVKATVLRKRDHPYVPVRR